MTGTMDEESRKHIAKVEKNSRFPTGIGRIERGECETGGLNPMACMFCPYGHVLECHYPYNCEKVKCSHYLQEMETEEPGWDKDEKLI